MKECVKKILKSNSIGKRIYEPIHQLYRLYSIPHRRRLLHKYGAATIAELSRQFKKHGIPGYATYGTLLGFIREEGFIPHDDDVDVAILPNDDWSARKVLRTLLSEPGFSYAFGFLYDQKLVEYKLYYNKIPVDFYFPEQVEGNFAVHEFYYDPNVAYPSAACNSARALVEPCVHELSKVKVLGTEFPVPSNSEEVLQGMYGRDWSIPNTKWNSSSAPRIIELSQFGIMVSKNEALSVI